MQRAAASFVMVLSSLADAIALAILGGELAPFAILDRCERTLGRPWDWVMPMVSRFLITLEKHPRPRHRDVVAFLLVDPGFRRACRKHASMLRVEQWISSPPRMQPVDAARQWNVPAIATVDDLADWLCLAPSELAWFADLRGLTRKCSGPLRHYHYRPLMKHSGSVRLIEIPKPNLKVIQRRILTGILDLIPAHPAAHGFVRVRSIKTFVAPHVGQRVVLRMDLRDFFPSIIGARIQAFFRTVGYPERVADLLGGLSTNAVPRDAWNSCDVDRETRDLYARPHLPQGAPTSPALANVCAHRLDCRLRALAASADATYTRYADDLAFSGGEFFERRVERFSAHVAALVAEEGFVAHHRKTRIMRQGVRQHLAGLVTNERVNVIRADFDRLKAILTNCARLGPQGQNREGHSNFRAHLDGRVSFVEMIHPEKGARLRAVFNGIAWPSD